MDLGITAGLVCKIEFYWITSSDLEFRGGKMKKFIFLVWSVRMTLGTADPG